MPSGKYIAGLIAIMAVVWLTMIFCLVIVYSLLPSMEQLPPGGIDRLLVAVIQLLVAGSILLAWLYSWNVLVKVYFWRNLNKAESRISKAANRKRR